MADDLEPRTARTTSVRLLAGVFIAPAAWITQLTVNYALAAYPCFPNDRPFATLPPSWAFDRALLLAVNLAAMAAALAGLWISRRSWRASAAQADAHAALEVGEGRTRFLSTCGIASSALFLAAIAFNTLPLLMAPQCSG